jgi:hypothetical protein
VAGNGALVLADFLEGQQQRIVSSLRASLPKDKAERKSWVKADPDWWTAAVEDAELAQALRVVYQDSAHAGLQNVADTLGRIVPNKAVQRVTADLLTYGGERIVDINAKTLQAITIELAEGTRRGYSVAQLIDGVPADNFRGVKNVGLDNGVGVWGDARAETIARTETALSYNRAALSGYKEFRVSQVTAIDGDKDDECATRNGATFSIDDAFGIADHPNGTLDWVPVIGDKAWHEPEEPMKSGGDVHIHLPEKLEIPAPIVNITTPEQPAPVVNVTATAAEQPAPVVNVMAGTAPSVNVTVPKPEVTFMPSAAKSSGVQDVRLVESLLPNKKRKVKRDLHGRVTEITEE